MKRIDRSPIVAILIITIAIGVSYIILRETPEECVQQKFLEWVELNKKELSSDSSQGDGIQFPSYDKSNSREVVARVKTIATFSESRLKKQESWDIVQSMRFILESCGVEY